MKFVGREKELTTLEKEYSRNNAFVVIYARRRVGKTTLIKEFLKNKLSFYFLATLEIESQSMKRLARVIARATKNPMLERVSFSDWLGLVEAVAAYKPEEKKYLSLMSSLI